MIRRLPQLDDLQRWMLRSISDSIGPSAAATPREIDDIILPSRNQTAVQRLAIYHHAYFARLLEVLRGVFPCTRYAVGDELFDEFATAYLEKYPPTSYTLTHLANKLVDYLDETRPPDWGQFLVELARLEQAIDRVFDGPGPEGLVVTAGQRPTRRLVPGFELHSFEFPVSTYFTNWKAGREPSWPDGHRQFVALFRRDYIVRRYEVSEVQHNLLRALHDGCSLGGALEKLAEGADPASVDALAADVRRWFEFWAREQFFVR